MSAKIGAMVCATLMVGSVGYIVGYKVAQPDCATHYSVHTVEDNYCAAYWNGDEVKIGPLSHVDGMHIIGSSD